MNVKNKNIKYEMMKDIVRVRAKSIFLDGAN